MPCNQAGPLYNHLKRSMWLTVRNSLKHSAVWNGGDLKGPMFFVGYFWVFSDKIATQLKSTACCLFVHDVWISFAIKYRGCLTGTVYTVVGFLPVPIYSHFNLSCSVHERRSPLYWVTSTNEVHAGQHLFFSQVNALMSKILQSRNDMMEILRPLTGDGWASLEVGRVRKNIGHCFPSVLPREVTLKEGHLVSWAFLFRTIGFVDVLVTMYDILDRQKSAEQHLRQTIPSRE